MQRMAKFQVPKLSFSGAPTNSALTATGAERPRIYRPSRSSRSPQQPTNSWCIELFMDSPPTYWPETILLLFSMLTENTAYDTIVDTILDKIQAVLTRQSLQMLNEYSLPSSAANQQWHHADG